MGTRVVEPYTGRGLYKSEFYDSCIISNSLLHPIDGIFMAYYSSLGAVRANEYCWATAGTAALTWH